MSQRQPTIPDGSECQGAPSCSSPVTGHQAPRLPATAGAVILAGLFRGARSSAVEHHLDMVGVTGSIPVARTTFFEAVSG
jgi:hypothetical protein